MNSVSTTPSFRIREARPSDVEAVARVHVDTFNETHTRFKNGPTYEIREPQWRAALNANDSRQFTFVVEDDEGTIVGFARGMPYASADIPDFDGELNKIYLLRRYHRRGIGRRLIGHIARRFLEQGVNSMLLFGDANNPTNGFYERLGAERLVGPKGEFHGGYGWRDLRQLAAQCTEP